MSVWQSDYPAAPYLESEEGDLLLVRATIEAHLLEELLEALAEVPFPINPEIVHHVHIVRKGRQLPAVHVEFPAWRQGLESIQGVLDRRRLNAALTVQSMLDTVGRLPY